MLGVALLNMGGPGGPGEVRAFLRALFSDRDLIRLPGGPALQGVFAILIAALRTRKVQGNYRRIGGGSPLLDLTRRQAEGLRRALAARGVPAAVEPLMRYTRPRAVDALRALRRAGADALVAVSLYPQFSRATTGSSLADLERAAVDSGLFPRRSVVDRYPEHPGYLEAVAERVREGLAGFPEERRGRVVLLFSAHSLPERAVREGDPYVAEIERTVAGVRARLPAEQPWRLGFQSRTGPVRWVGPDTAEVLRDLGREGVREVLVVPAAFVSDHIETLYEIDLLFAEDARAAGIADFRRAPSLNDSPTFAAALADLVLEAAP